MPIKKVANKLNTEARSEDAVISVFTNSKKGHFTCSEAKLFENLEDCLHDIHKFYQVHLTTHPTVAVHITGDADKLKNNEIDLRERIIATLTFFHDIGNVQ